jgi:hypothetical protein
MDNLFYTEPPLTETETRQRKRDSWPVMKGMDTPSGENVFELLEFDTSILFDKGLTVYDIEWTSEGITTNLDQAAAAKKETDRKNKHESAAYKQQDSFFNPNKRHLFDGVVYNAPPADMDQLPKMQVYRIFMQSLWLEYHTRIQSGSEDYDYSSFKPSQEYSYVELETEWANYNQVTT